MHSKLKFTKIVKDIFYYSEGVNSFSKSEYEYLILAVENNIDFNKELVSNDIFRKNNYFEDSEFKELQEGVYLTNIYFFDDHFFKSFFNLFKYRYQVSILSKEGSFYSQEKKVLFINFLTVFWALFLFLVIFLSKFLLFKYLIKINLKRWFKKLFLSYISFYLIILFLYNFLFFNFFKKTDVFNIKITFILFFLLFLIDFLFIFKTKKKVFISLVYSFLINLLTFIFFIIFNSIFNKIFIF